MLDHLQDQMHLHGLDPLHGKKIFVCKRDGRIEEFNEARICLAVESAFKAVEGVDRDSKLPSHHQVFVKKCADVVVERMLSRAVRGEELEVEKIQDAVEDQLMLDGHLAVARRYILYREKRRLARAEREGRVASLTSVAAPMESPIRKNPPPLPPLPEPATAPPLRQEIPASSETQALLRKIYSQALAKLPPENELAALHQARFAGFIEQGQYLNQLAPELMDFDLELLARSLRLERDQLFPLAGLQALHDEFLLQDSGQRIETPQYFWMRVAMGLTLNEVEQRNARAVEFYEALSTFRFVPSETILSHAGTVHPQLLTCFSATSWGDLEHVRAQVGARLEQRHKTGVTCSWLEPWHAGILDFLQRPRLGAPTWTHDMNKALWVPDLFMKRVRANGKWTLFQTAQVPDLHQKFGHVFEQLYAQYEEKAVHGEMPGSRQINAADLWQEILASLAQTGQPWLGFKDAANVRSTQDHAGVVHSASLCTAILLNTSSTEASACSIGSINLAAHLKGASAMPLDPAALRNTVNLAMRMLDNAIDITAYPGDAARRTGWEHRPVALGVLGFQEALDWMKVNYASAAAADFADHSTELISQAAILASAGLARERGAYPSYEGSKWSHGFLPIDTLALLTAERGMAVDIDLSLKQEWDAVRATIRHDGLRHSTTTAISATDAGAKIAGVSPSIEPGGREKNGRRRTPYEIAPHWMIECAARRQKWLDMGQSLNLYCADLDLAGLSEVCMQAWEKGLKTVRQVHSTVTPAGQKSQATIEPKKEKQPEAPVRARASRSKPEPVVAK